MAAHSRRPQLKVPGAGTRDLLQVLTIRATSPAAAQEVYNDFCDWLEAGGPSVATQAPAAAPAPSATPIDEGDKPATRGTRRRAAATAPAPKKGMSDSLSSAQGGSADLLHHSR